MKERERERGIGRWQNRWFDQEVAGGARRDSRGEPRGDITSFFFSNISESVGELDLWQAFQKWGRIWDIFIPQERLVGKEVWLCKVYQCSEPLFAGRTYGPASGGWKETSCELS